MSEPQLNQLHQKIDQGVNKAIAVWQNGEVVILSADQILNLENQNFPLD